MKLLSKLKENIKELKEADDFVKSEYDTEEEQKDDKIVRIILLVLAIVLLVLFGVIIFAIKTPISTIYKTYSEIGVFNNNDNNDNNNNTNSDNPYINGGNGNSTYKSYKIGDQVSLRDNSKWYVIENSKEDDPRIKLLSINNINDGSINYKNAEEYLDSTYKNNLAKALKTEASDLNARLISLYDISILSGINEETLDVNSVLQNKTPAFIYQTINLTNYTDDDDKPVLICPNNGNAILCSGNPPMSAWIIKPVIELPKDLIK